MKSLLSVLRILIGVFGGVFVISTLSIFLANFHPALFSNDVFSGSYGEGGSAVFLISMFFSGIITLLLVILYFAIDNFFKKSLKDKMIIK